MDKGREHDVTRHSIEDWFHEYERDVTSFLIYYTGTMDVEDLVQDTFMIALKKLSTFKGDAHPKTWLISIARNQVLDTYRRRQRWSRLAQLLGAEQRGMDEVEGQLIRSQATEELYRAIRRLSPKPRELVILRGILELSSKEAATILNSTDNAVNVMYHRALKKLKQVLEEEETANGRDKGIT